MIPAGPPPSPLRRFALYLKRAMHLACPECGVFPVFKPLRHVRGITDWLRPLDTCPRCRYRYEREQGYFLLSTWVINYTIVGGLGLTLALSLDALIGLTLRQQILYIILPMPLLSLLLARHAKALFLAVDHYYDPQRRDDSPSDDDDGPDLTRRPPPRTPPAPGRRPRRRTRRGRSPIAVHS